MNGMVISESTVTRKILRGVLRAAGLSEIALFESGREGFWATRSEHFDVVLLDYPHSDVPVLDLISTLRLQAGRMAIFVFGAETSKDYVVELIQAGVTGFIIRPFKLPVVTGRIKEALAEPSLRET